jgi:hypothetical protein
MMTPAMRIASVICRLATSAIPSLPRGIVNVQNSAKQQKRNVSTAASAAATIVVMPSSPSSLKRNRASLHGRPV